MVSEGFRVGSKDLLLRAFALFVVFGWARGGGVKFGFLGGRSCLLRR